MITSLQKTLLIAKFDSTASNTMQQAYDEHLRQLQKERDNEAIEEQRRREEELKKRAQIEEEQQRKERERLESLKKEEEYLRLLSEIRTNLKTDFLKTDQFYKEHCAGIVPINEYKEEKVKFVQCWFKSNNFKDIPDEEQAAAIASTSGHVQVVARAGSGKTLTIVNRAFFLQKHCHVAPDKILLLAFNKHAVNDIENKLKTMRDGEIPHVMTFHALARGLVHPKETILYDDPRSANQGLSSIIQDVIDDHLKSKIFYKQIRELMLTYFREDWLCIESGGYDKTEVEQLKYLRSLPSESLKGDYVKSYGEKVIANFLFEHDIPYMYEYDHGWDEFTEISYRPDFTIFKTKKSGIVIEYFGLTGEPDYDEQSNEKRLHWNAKPDWKFLEFNPDDIKQGNIENVLKSAIENEGFKCERLSEDEIWNRIEKRAIDRYTKTNTGFIGKCRKLEVDPDELADRIKRHTTISEAENQFLEIVQAFYKAYLERLTETNGEDFDGLMQRAINVIQNGQTVFERTNERMDLKSLNYIFIDEYQDFSFLFHRLTNAIRLQNPRALFFCVGDDWQAINGFAGSDLRFYEKFGNYFPSSERLYVATNYRSEKSIVDIGNELMSGYGKPAVASKQGNGQVLLVDLNDFKPSIREKERHLNDNLMPILLRLVKKEISVGSNVVLLSRTNASPRSIYSNYKIPVDNERGIKEYLKRLYEFLPKTRLNHISIDTAHKYKGLQKNTVIILDAVKQRYPLIHPMWFFSRILGDDLDKIQTEERRLFYVALTRAITKLIIITEGGRYSPFLKELIAKSRIKKINWSDFPMVRDEIGRLTVKVDNHNHREIKTLLSAHGYRWQPFPEEAWTRSFQSKDFSIDALKDTAWAKSAKGVGVTVVNEQGEAVAHYTVNGGNWSCIVDKLENIKC